MISFKRISAIFIKEIQDFKTNLNIVFMYLVPILIVYIYNNLIPNLPQGFVLSFGLLFLVVMVGMYVPAMIISEEKEKRTLEVLILSPATAQEIFIGKGLLTFVTMMITMFILLAVSGNGLENLNVILTGTIIISLFSIMLGMIVGLLSPNQMSTGIIGTPIYLLLMLIPLLTGIGVESIEKIAYILPTYHYFKMLELSLGEQNKMLADLLPQISTLTFSTVVSFAALMLTYKKKGLE